ncbi:hypothetical protein D9M71_715950 [compost metagenome]
MHETCDHHAHQDRADAGHQGDLVGGGALGEQAPDQWAQEVLECGFDLVDAGHVDEVSGEAIWLLSVDGILGWIWRRRLVCGFNAESVVLSR